MQNRNKMFLSLVLAQILFNGCGSGGSGSTSSTSTERSTKNIDYWGEWESIDNSSKTVYITSQTGGNIEAVKDQENLIVIDGKYFKRIGSRNVNFTGSVYDDGAGRILSGFESIAGIEIILRNSNDENIEATVKSDANGVFKDNSLPAGDYKLTVNDVNRTVETNVSLVRDGQDIGAFQLVPKGLANFQTNFQSQTEFFYGNGTVYSGEVVVRNIGYDVGRGLSYDISLDGAKTFSKNNVLGSIAVGDEVRIPVTFSFDSQVENEKTYKIKVKIADSSKRIWQDSGTITVYKNSFNFNLSAEKVLNGTIKYPSGKFVSINSKNKTVTLPSLSADKNYVLNLVNYGSFAEEGIYGFSTTGSVSTGEFAYLTDTSSYEPNDKLSEAPIIKTGDSQVNAYLHFEDVDYFKIYSPQIDKTIEELNNKAPTVYLSVQNSAIRGQNVSFSFNGTDDEGIVKYELSSNIDGKLYSGLENSFSTSSLSEGNHMISLVGYDK